MLEAVRGGIGEERFEFERDLEGRKRWRLSPSLLTGLFRLEATEFAALEEAAGLARREGDEPLARGLEEIGTKLRATSDRTWLRRVDPDLEALTEAQGFALRPGPRPKIDEALLEALRGAVLARRQVRLLHRKSPDARAAWQKVAPLGFLYGSRHYLVAWSARRKCVVLFRLSRIERVVQTDEVYEAPEGFDLEEFARRSFGVFQEESVDVALRFVPGAAAEAREYCFHPSQRVEEGVDGSLWVRFRAGGLREMAWHLFTWGADVEVVEPRALRGELVHLLEQSLRRHSRELRKRTRATAGRSRSGSGS
jgi:predicted DNA-binding transcriptional regulator YafY